MKILIADDHAIVRQGLKLILRESGNSFSVGEARNGEELLQRVGEAEWDVVILDISLPDQSGLEILKRLKALRPKLPVLILSMHGEEQYAVRALRSGASGYLTKESASEQLLQAIQKIHRGGRYVTPAVAESLVAEIAGDSSDQPHLLLSDREFEVLRLIVKGKTATEIASQLNISIKTVSTYRRRVLDKMGMTSMAQLIHYSIEHRLV